MLLVGLTGGIASGKTLVSDTFKLLGVPIIDADVLAREVVAPGSEGLLKLVGQFGKKMLSDNGSLNRAQLRDIIFKDPAARKIVDDILHPLIRQLSTKRIAEAQSRDHHYAVYAVPLLVESNQQDRFDSIVVVDVPTELQLERIMARDGGSLEQAESILAAQATRELRLAVADHVIDNNGSKASTASQVQALHKLFSELQEAEQKQDT